MNSTLFNLKSIKESDMSITLLNRSNQCNKETYMYSTIEYLKEFNNSNNDLTKKLYSSILEAENKNEENDMFCDYFDRFKTTITTFTGRMNELISRFRINIDNYIDANKDLIHDDDITTNFHCDFGLGLFTFSHLSNDEYPKFCPMDIYKKEFDYIGTLMQELDPTASNVDKLKIISTVYNNLTKDLNNNWTERCIGDILPSSSLEHNGLSFAERVYKSLRSDLQEVTVTKATIFNAKECLCNYTEYTDSAIRIGNHLISCFNKIADEIGDMIFRKKDGKLCIRTTTDGVADRDYLLDVYSMNNLDIFMKAKINQISQLCNLYTVAFSIKLDVIYDFLVQNKDLLERAKINNKCKVQSDPEPVSTPAEEPISDENISYDEKDHDSDEDDKDNDEGDKDDDDSDDDSDSEDENKELDESSLSCNEYFNAEYIFEYSIFNFERLLEQEELTESIKSLLEADEETTEDKPKDSGNSAIADADKNNMSKMVDWFVEKIKELFRKFYDYFINKTESKIEFIKTHVSNINEMKSDSGKFKTLVESYKTKNVLKPDMLRVYEVSDFNYEQMKDTLSAGEKDFISKYIKNGSDIVKEMENGDNNFITAIKNTIILGPDETTLQVEQIQQGIDFCLTEYKNLINPFKKEISVIDRAKSNIKNIAKAVGESYNLESTEDEYFSEVTEDETKKDTVDAANIGNTRKDVQLYFKISSQLLSAKMTSANAVFNEYYMIISKLLQKSGVKVEEEKKDETNK